MAATVSPSFERLVRLQFETRGFTLAPRQPVQSLLSGRHASRLRGRGLVFEELRDYRPGDDIRSIDWRATARRRKPHVRVYSEERDRPVLFVVDQRTTMFFGSERTTKAGAAAELAALGAWTALEAGDRAGALIFSDDERVEIAPRRSRAAVLHICRELARINSRLAPHGPPASSAALNDALRRAVNLARHDHLIVLITDYDGDDETTQKLASRLAAHNDVLAALVYDPAGIRLPTSGPTELTDGTRRATVADGAHFAERFEAEFRRRCDVLRERLSGLRIPILPICTHEPVAAQVLAALGGRPTSGTPSGTSEAS